MKRPFVMLIVLLMFFMVSIVYAELNVYFTDATMSVSDSQTIRIHKITVEGYSGTYWVDFRWNPEIYMLEPVAAGQETSGQNLDGPANVGVANTGTHTIGAFQISSSSKLTVSWTAPTGYTVDHYEIVATESIMNTSTAASATATELSKTITGLKADTTYSLTVASCKDSSCSQSGSSAVVTGKTDKEYWQLQGSGNSTSGLTKIVSDGNARISATRFGAGAGAMADKIQLYYGAAGVSGLVNAVTSQAAEAGNTASYLAFTRVAGSTGIISPQTATTLVKQVATGQGVPLSAEMGSKVRLFFEANGNDNKTRIMYLDSQDGYKGQDFNTGSASYCSTSTDYQAGGGCAPVVSIGVEGDATNANSKIINARQFKLGWPILNDWRWDGAAGTFMVFTTDQVSGCSTSGMNHGYAVWDGTKWNVQYADNGCPKLFTSAQAAFPMHIGEAKYKLYYGDPSITTGKGSSSLPFLGPKKLIYADGRSSGSATVVDFEDWEAQGAARDVVFLWPNGEQLNATAEGYIDDYHFLSPTGSPDLQVMYMAITDGTVIPFAAAAVLANP